MKQGNEAEGGAGTQPTEVGTSQPCSGNGEARVASAVSEGAIRGGRDTG